MDYGTGAIMGVPAHDERDFEFATKYGLEIRQVIKPVSGVRGPVSGGADTGHRKPDTDKLPVTSWDGALVNSGQFNGKSCKEAVTAVTKWLAGKNLGTPQIQYKLHDWCISRQRYWGRRFRSSTATTAGSCRCRKRTFRSSCDHRGLPARRLRRLPPCPARRVVSRSLPECGKMGRRETDVSDTFLDSAWYFLRYPPPGSTTGRSTRRSRKVASGDVVHRRERARRAPPHVLAVHHHGAQGPRHLAFEEPFTRFRAHGTIVKDGAKMSKSQGNVVIPDLFIAKWAPTLSGST